MGFSTKKYQETSQTLGESLPKPWKHQDLCWDGNFGGKILRGETKTNLYPPTASLHLKIDDWKLTFPYGGRVDECVPPNQAAKEEPQKTLDFTKCALKSHPLYIVF